MFKSPEFRIIEIQDGDATCGNIDAPDHLQVFLSTELCKKVHCTPFFRAQIDMNIDSYLPLFLIEFKKNPRKYNKMIYILVFYLKFII